MTMLTIEEVLFIHFQIMNQIQGDLIEVGLMNPEALQSALLRPLQSIGGVDAYPSDCAKAAALTESIISGHPFKDGNKRIGITVGCMFLIINGYHMLADAGDLYTAAMSIADGSWKFGAVNDWFERHFE